MQIHKTCSLCGVKSEDTAVFTCTYAKGELEICLGCLAEGVLETAKQTKTQSKTPQIQSNIEPIMIDLSIPNEVYGFTCESCNNIMFSDMFPVQCENCQHINHKTALQRNR
jgi:hypothetical protein